MRLGLEERVCVKNGKGYVKMPRTCRKNVRGEAHKTDIRENLQM